jgi:CRP/FNR family cyclic AMP-dependent transcriptional regulator
MPTGNWIMARKVKGPSFDPSLLLAKTGRGRSKLEYRSEEVVFSQGDAADSIFYILRGKIKIVAIREGSGNRSA